jgi:ELWxxDGT repeat protein
MPGFLVGGTVEGLEGELRLASSTGETLVITQDGPFALQGELSDGAPFEVTIAASPALSVCSIEGGNGTIAGSDVESIAVRCSRKVIFHASVGSGARPWITDGTETGTYALDVPGATAGLSEVVHVGNGIAIGQIALEGGEAAFWRTDGTEAGTATIPGAPSSGAGLMALDGRVYFRAMQSLHWTDGETVGAVDLGVEGSPGKPLGAIGGRLVVPVVDGTQTKLVATDGTTTTELLAVSDSWNQSSLVRGSELFFEWRSPDGSAEVWRTDGTPAGTSLVVGCPADDLSEIQVSDDGRVWFAAEDSVFGYEPHVTTATGYEVLDVTTTGGSQAFHFLPLGAGVVANARLDSDNHLFLLGGEPSIVDSSAAFDGRVYVVGTLDGSAVFTKMENPTFEATLSIGTGVPGDQELIPLGSDVGVRLLGEVDGRLIVHAEVSDALGREPIVTDGTPEGTFVLGDLCPGMCSSL